MSANHLRSQLLAATVAAACLLNCGPLAAQDEVAQENAAQTSTDTDTGIDLPADIDFAAPGDEFSDGVGGGDINFDLDEMEGFGDEDFQVEAPLTAEDLATATWWFGVLGAACCGVPALLIGLTIGFLIGRRGR